MEHSAGLIVARCLVALLLLVAGCGADPAPSQMARWACPATWVAYERGGCGPAVLLCVPGGGAAPGACAGVDLTRPPTLTLADGGTVPGFYRLPDGGIGGGWPAPGAPGAAPTVGLTACAEGWQRLPDGTCDPMLRTDCPEGSGALPGGRCTPTALSDCPAGEYADPGAEALGQTVVHVRAGADATIADGSVARPFATITDGVARVGLRGWVLVARGEYSARLLVTRGASVHVLGVCAARVTLRGSGPATQATAEVTGARAELDLRGLTITGTGAGALSSSGGTLRARGVVLVDNVGVGILATGGSLAVLALSVVRGSRPRADGTLGFGLGAQEGATLRATGLLVAENSELGVGARGSGTVVELDGSTVRATRPRTDGRYGVGLAAQGGATLRATGLLIVENTEAGVNAAGSETILELAASVVRETRPRSDGTGGVGLAVLEGATARATGVLVADNVEVGVFAGGRGALAELSASVVRGTRSRADGTFGFGLRAQGGATLRATGALLAESGEVGVSAEGADTLVELAASSVRAVRPGRDGLIGRGMEFVQGAALRATGVVVAESREVGALAFDPSTEVRMTDVILLDQRPSDLGLGVGLYAALGARLVATRVAVQTVHGAGVVALPVGAGSLTTVTVRDLFVREVRAGVVRFDQNGGIARPVGRPVAYGLHPGPGCVIDATRVVLDQGGYGFFNAGGALSLRQAVISRQLEGAGAVDLATPDGATTLEGVSFVDNATNTVTRRSDLPTASELPAPTRTP